MAADAIRDPADCIVVVAGADDGVADIIARLIRSRPDEPGGAVLLIIDQSVLPIDRAMLIAAVGPLAVTLAPDRRLVAIDVIDGARVDAVNAAAEFLAAARSTTGQVLRVGG